jgi:hypothetical protein
MGLQPTSYPGAAICPKSATSYAAPLVMSAKDIESLSQKRCCEILKLLKQSTHGNVQDMQKRLKCHYRV